MRKGTAIPIVFSLALLASAVHAQPTGIDAGSLLRQEEEAQRAAPRPLPSRREPVPLPELTSIGGITVRVNEVRFTGATELLGQSALNESVAEGLDRVLDFNGLKALAARVTRELKAAGWILARAYLPEQDVTGGTVIIGILPGFLDQDGEAIEVRPLGDRPLRVDPRLLQSIATQSLGPQLAIRETDLDRALLIMNDLPSVTARARLERGASPGSSRIVINASEPRLLTATAMGNSFGNRSTGVEQAYLGLQLNDPFGAGDRLSLGLTHAEGLRLSQLAYQRLQGTSGLALSANYTDLRYEVVAGAAAEAADYKGDAHTFSLGFRYPHVRSRRVNVWSNVQLGRDVFVDRIDSLRTGDKLVLHGSYALEGSVLDPWRGGGRTDWLLKPTWGELNLARIPGARDADAKSFQTAGGFGKLEYSLSRLQSLQPGFSVYASLNGQLSTKNLDTSQKFRPAGPNGVRAYAGSEAAADQGVLLKTELRFEGRAPKGVGRFTAMAFYDAAWVGLSANRPANVPIDTRSGENRYRIEGAGLGASLNRPGRYLLRVIWARKIGSNPGDARATGRDNEDRDDNHRVWLQGVLWL